MLLLLHVTIFVYPRRMAYVGTAGYIAVIMNSLACADLGGL